jgi:hypothetical protein
MVNGPTRACSAYIKLHQLDANNWWAVFGEQDLVCIDGGGFNALCCNQYSTMLPDSTMHDDSSRGGRKLKKYKEVTTDGFARNKGFSQYKTNTKYGRASTEKCKLNE